MSARLAGEGHNWLGLAAMTCMYCVAKRTAGWGRVACTCLVACATMRPRRWHTEVQLTSKVVSCLGFVVGLMAQARASLAGWLAGWLDLGLVLAPSSKVPGWASRWPYGYRPTGAQRRTKCKSSEPERRLARLLERLGTSERTEKGCTSRLLRLRPLPLSHTHALSLLCCPGH